MPKNIFREMSLITSKVKRAKEVFLFSDYDGTLVPIVSKPEHAKPSKEVLLVIKKISGISKSKVAIVSGRPIKELRKFLPISNIFLIGIHGLEYLDANGKRFTPYDPLEIKPVFEKIKEEMERVVGIDKGLFMEDKKLSLALHYRLAKPANSKKAIAEFKKLIVQHSKTGLIEIISGKKVFEARPRGWNKGKAVENMLHAYASRKCLPIYIGDDRTDEDAFDLLKQKGITIFVGKSTKRTKATFYVKDSSEVLQFLTILTQIVRQY